MAPFAGELDRSYIASLKCFIMMGGLVLMPLQSGPLSPPAARIPPDTETETQRDTTHTDIDRGRLRLFCLPFSPSTRDNVVLSILETVRQYYAPHVLDQAPDLGRQNLFCSGPVPLELSSQKQIRHCTELSTFKTSVKSN
ncbi:unnamed protein product [Pleuronectes platessa]|uniref:Uncharacterized protein n=1 Tax=Pleuronectes platessa TaxID=8262 RepID=A0A9N7Y8L2_PLEPL|nr:unnamed protein product [Pleuronectes platessa]